MNKKICAIDTETTGLDMTAKIVELAIVPLTSNFDPDPDCKPFHIYVNPGNEYLHELELPCKALLINGLSRDFISDNGESVSVIPGHIRNWMQKNKISTIEPVAQNWAYDSKMIELLLGFELRSELYGDASPFEGLSLQKLAKHFGIDSGKAHSAVDDALTCAAVYKELIRILHTRSA